MGLVKRAADLAYTFRFIRMLVMDWKNWDAYKLGIIGEDGKREKSVKLDTDEKKSAYTPFIRLCANIKKLVSAVPGGGSKLGSFASALYLVKEQYGMNDKQCIKVLEACSLEPLDFLSESNKWFVLDNDQLSPGLYRLYNSKLLNKTFDEMVFAKDVIRIKEDCYPVGNIFGINIYEATHMKTNQNVFITVNEIYK
jgi:hypothetical protein